MGGVSFEEDGAGEVVAETGRAGDLFGEAGGLAGG